MYFLEHILRLFSSLLNFRTEIYKYVFTCRLVHFRIYELLILLFPTPSDDSCNCCNGDYFQAAFQRGVRAHVVPMIHQQSTDFHVRLEHHQRH